MTRLHFLYAILVSVVLLPWISISPSAPGIRPEWLLLLVSLLAFHRILAKAIDSAVVFWSVAVGISSAISIAYGVAFLGVAVDLSDLFELLKPVLYLLLYVFVASTCLSVHQLRRFLCVALLTLSVAGVLSIVQYFAPEVVSPILTMYTDAERVSLYAQLRATGTMGNANALGMLFVFGYALALFTHRHRLFGTVPASAVLLIMLLGLLASGSRTAFVCMFVVTLCYLLSEVKLRLKSVLAVGIISVALFKVCSSNLEILRGPIERYATLMNMARDTAWKSRVYGAVETLAEIKQSVFVGHGPDKIGFIMGSNVDNEYVLTLYRYGVVGLLVLGGFFYSLWRQSQVRNPSSLPLVRSYAHFATAVLLASLVFAYTAGMYQVFRLMMLLIIFLTVAGQARLDGAEERIVPETVGVPNVVSLNEIPLKKYYLGPLYPHFRPRKRGSFGCFRGFFSRI
jgi:hypothetical protein